VYCAALHCGNAIETGPLYNFLWAEFLAAPRANDDVRREIDYLLRRHNAILG
jgi:hypothetical protein